MKSIKKNFLFNLSYQIISYITPLITAPYLARVLGADGIGQISLATSITTYYVLFATLGITTYGTREISSFQDDINKRSELFWNIKVLEFITSSIAIIIYIIIGIKTEGNTLYFVLSLNILSVFFDVTWFFQGVEEFGKITLRNFVIKGLNILFIFLFIKSKEDLVLYAFGIVFFGVTANISLWTYLPKFVKKPIFKNIHPFFDIKGVLLMFLPTISISIYTVLDKTMIGVITKNYFENGYYDQAIKLPNMLLAIVYSLILVSIPRLSKFYQDRDKKSIDELVYNSFRSVWFIALPLCFGLIMISNNFIPWFLGDGFEKTAFLMKILSLLIVFIGISSVSGTLYLSTTRQQNKVTFSVTFGAVLNLMLNLILIPKYASLGAAIASIVAEGSIALIQLFMIKNDFSIKRIFKEGNNYFISVIVMVIILLPLSKNVPVNIFGTAVIGGVGAAVYFICLLILKDNLFIGNLIGMFKQLKQKFNI